MSALERCEGMAKCALMALKIQPTFFNELSSASPAPNQGETMREVRTQLLGALGMERNATRLLRAGRAVSRGFISTGAAAPRIAR
jgi:hypothetical protein